MIQYRNEIVARVKMAHRLIKEYEIERLAKVLDYAYTLLLYHRHFSNRIIFAGVDSQQVKPLFNPPRSTWPVSTF